MKHLFILIALTTAPLFAENTDEPMPSLNPGPPALEAKSKKILHLLGNLENPKGRAEFLASFPKTKSSFTELCINEYTLPTSDCHEVILNGLGKTAKEKDSVNETAKILVKLSSELGFDADAPNYVQETVSNLCVASASEFAGAINTLTTRSQQKALKFMNEGFSDSDREEYVKCLVALKGKGQKALAEQGKKYLVRKKSI